MKYEVLDMNGNIGMCILDKCIKDEIIELNRFGIHTINSCCGHQEIGELGFQHQYIQIELNKEQMTMAKDKGYNFQIMGFEQTGELTIDEYIVLHQDFDKSFSEEISDRINITPKSKCDGSCKIKKGAK